MDLVQSFLNFLQAQGIPASNSSEIIADDKRRRFNIVGDKPRSKNGSYQLKIDGEFAVGWGMTFKDGVVHKFTSKSPKRLTPDEKQAFARKVEAERKKKERERLALGKEAQQKAEKLWKKAAKTGTTAYLQRKKAGLNSARILGKLLLVPAFIDGKVSTLQFVAENGEKRFLTNGNLEGGYFPIANKDEDKSVFLLCEGFATGDSIRKATNLPVIVCFNSNNLLPVAAVLKAKYPNSKFIFCADNDQFTIINEQKVNVGIEKAKSAAAKIGGAFVVYPEFPDNEKNKYTDFNDAYLSLGAEYVLQRIEPVVLKIKTNSSVGGGEGDAFCGFVEQQPESSVPLPVHQSKLPIAQTADWREQLAYDDKGALAKNNLRNATLFLLNDPNLVEAFVFDEFHNRVICQKDITGANPKFKVHAVDDYDIMQLCLYFERLGLIKDERKVAGIMNYVAGLNRINPARDYFNSLKWDGIERLDYWLAEGFGAPEPEEYLAAIGRNWLVAAVKRVFEPGCKFDHILMMEGIQGAGKSSAMKLLAAFNEVVKDPLKHEPKKSYFTDALTFDAISDKDSMLLTSGAIIVVLEELVGKSKRSDDEIKRWITLGTDKGRLPYGRFVTEMPRQFVLAGTTNNYDYLKDPTGNRRYWPLTVKTVDKIYINENREQLWAEAVHLFKQDVYLALTGDILQLAEMEQKKRLEEDVWETAVADALIDLHYKPFSTAQLLKAMHLPLKDQDSRAMGRVKNILKKMGYENKPTRVDNDVQRMWSKNDEK